MSLSIFSSYIYFGEDTRATYVELPVYVGSVPTEHIDSFDEKLHASLARIIDEGVDMERMAMVISRDERQVSMRLLFDASERRPLTASHSCAARLRHRRETRSRAL